MKHPLIIAFVVLALPAVSFACIWDSDTLEDELKQNASTFNVITGQFAQHGEAYYRARLERSKEELILTPDSIETLYDMGAAYLRLGEHENALDAFERVEQIAPDRYKTHSNLGVLYGEMDKPELAIKHMEQALAKHPTAHFGAGWLHLRMVEWENMLWETGVPGVCFLGTPYDGSQWDMSVRNHASKRAKEVGLELEKDYDGVKVLTTLLRANPDFADGYFVLAKNLHNSWDLNLALWAYVKAKTLGHPRADIIDKAIDEIFAHWKDTIKHGQHKRGQRLESKAKAIAKIEKQLLGAKPWVGQFHTHEATWIQTTGNLPGFDEVRGSLERAGIKRCEPMQVGLIGAVGGRDASPANSDEHQASPAEGGKRARSRPKPKAQSQANEELDGLVRAMPAQDGPPVGGLRSRDIPKREELQSPPEMNAEPKVFESRAPAVQSDVQASDSATVALPSAPGEVHRGSEPPAGAVIGQWSEPQTLEPRPAESTGLPWFVWFGIGMLVVSLGAVVIARGRTA